MNRFLSIGLGVLFGVGWATLQTSHAINVQFDAETNSDFNVGTNWDDNNAPTADGDVHIIENGLTADLTGTATINGIIVGDTAGVGILNVNSGSLNVDVAAGFPQGFSIGGHHGQGGIGTVNVNGTGVVNVAVAGGSPDSGFIGDREDGTLNIRDNGVVNAPGIVWRIGLFGGFFGPTLFTAEGTVNVEDNGRFDGHFWYLGAAGGKSTVTVRDNGSINLSLGFDSRAIAQNPLSHSSTIEMIGSNASWTSGNMRLDTINGAPRNHVIFTSDAGGVSPMLSLGLLDYEDAELTVDLNGFGELARYEEMLLFDGPTGELTGETFGVLNVLGVADTSKYALIYRNSTGDILLTNIPEPSTLALVALAVAGMIIRGRQRS